MNKQKFKIIYLKEVNSTHKYLQTYIKQHNYTSPLAVFTSYQTDGIGSRNNKWIGIRGNVFFSFVIDKSLLPQDLPIASSSIYFSMILKIILRQYSSKVWLKWPNDFYIEDKKIGGTITKLDNDLLFCGIGINQIAVDDFGFLDIQFDKNILIKYFEMVSNPLSWQEIFSKYQEDFHLSSKYYVNLNDQKLPLRDAILNFDGSITINNQKFYSLR